MLKRTGTALSVTAALLMVSTAISSAQDMAELEAAAKAEGMLTTIALPHDYTLGGLIDGLDMDKARKQLIADMAVVDPTAGGNPVKLTKKAALTLLEQAIAG